MGSAAGMQHRLRAARLLLALLAAGAASSGAAAVPAAPSFALVLATTQGGETRLWQRLPEDPALLELGLIRHQSDFLPRVALSPDGHRLAYTRLITGSQPETDPAVQLGLFDLTSGTDVRLAPEVDLRSTPLWSTDGSSILFRQTYQHVDMASRVELHALEIGSSGATRLIVAEEASTLVPLLWSADGTLLYGRWGNGVDLQRIEPGGSAPRTLARLSDGPAHNLSLSPDGRTAAYTRPLARAASAQHSVFLVSIATGAVRQRWTEVNDHLNPVWRPDAQSITIATRGPSGALANLRQDDLVGGPPQTVQAGPPGRLEVPLAWSPDGRWLIIRSLQGTNSYDLTDEELVLVDSARGAREAIRRPGHTTFIGWRSLAP